MRRAQVEKAEILNSPLAVQMPSMSQLAAAAAESWLPRVATVAAAAAARMAADRVLQLRGKATQAGQQRSTVLAAAVAAQAELAEVLPRMLWAALADLVDIAV